MNKTQSKKTGQSAPTSKAAGPTPAVVPKAGGRKPATAKVVSPRALVEKAIPKATAGASTTARKQKVAAPAKVEATETTSAKLVANKKIKLAHLQFTILESERHILTDVKKASVAAGFPVKKRDLVRVALASLKSLSIAELTRRVTALGQLKSVKRLRKK